MDSEAKNGIKVLREINTVRVLRTQLTPEISTEMFKDFIKSERAKESRLIKDQINVFARVAYFNYYLFVTFFTLEITFIFKGTVMQIEKALINDCLRVSTIYNFTVIYP